MNIKFVLPSIWLFFVFFSCNQIEGQRTISGEEFAKVELKEFLSDTTLHNIVDENFELIRSKITAVFIAEKILFDIYGKENIEKQKPYEVYKIEKYWSISGTLPKGQDGGTFLIIMDAMDGKIIRITHGK